jgi:hypothetical protein
VAGTRPGPYLIEVAPRGRSDAGALAERARSAAGETRFLRSVFVPEDDRWFLLYEAGSSVEVAAAVERAGLDVLSIAVARDLRAKEE